MARKLTNLVIDRVDLVDKGANPHAAIVLAKRHVELKEKRVSHISKLKDMMLEIFKAEGEEPPAAPVATGGKLHPDHVQALKAHHEVLGNIVKSYGEGPHPDGHPVHELSRQHVELGKVLAGCEGSEEPMAKEVDPEVAKRLTDIEKQNTDLRKQLDGERELRLNGEVHAILKSFKATPFNVDMKDEKNDVVKFRKMKEADPDTFDRLIAVMRAQDEEIAKSDLFKKNLGSDQGGTGTAAARLQALADGVLAKGETGMTKDKAYAKACEENPGLVREMRRGQ